MTETHVVSALRAKRAEISGHIYDLEKKIGRLRASLLHVDASIRLFSPEANPDTIPMKRTYRRTRYFAARELPRRCLDALREANGTQMTGTQIATIAMLAKGMSAEDDALRAVIIERTLAVLGNLRKSGTVIKTGTTRDAQWALAPSLL